MRLVDGGRAGRFARETARKEQLELARANLPLLLGIFLLVGAVPVVAALFLPGAVRGLLIGAGLTNAVWMTYWFVVTGSGSAPKMSGADAEEWSSGGLARLRKLGWRHVDGLTFDNTWDIDHVAFGPPGIYVIETKWSASRWFDRGNRPTSYLRAAVAKAERARRELRDELKRTSNPIEVRVSAVLVLWGKHAPEGERIVDGVAVIPGRRLAAFFARQTGSLDALTLDRVADVLARIDRETASTRRPESRYVASGFRGIATDVFFGLLGGTAAMLLLAGMWDRLSLALYAFVAGAVLVVGVVAMGVRYLRIAAVGWTVGAVGVLLLLTIAVAADVVVIP